MFYLNSVPYLWISFFLVVCSFFDFYSSKIPNRFILISLVISFFTIILLLPFSTLFVSLQSFLVMFAVGFLLFKLNVLGGGDIKALCIASLFLAPSDIYNFLIFSIIWAGAYALIFYLISGQIFKVLYNTFGVYKRFAVPNNKIPFTFGILLGWFSLFTLGTLSW